jgi:hypothetical protein
MLYNFNLYKSCMINKRTCMMKSVFGLCSMVVEIAIPQFHEVISITVHTVRLFIKQSLSLHKQ